MNIGLFMDKRDWTAIFVASILLIFLLGMALISHLFIWIVLFILFIVGGFSCYFAFFKVYDEDDNELKDMLKSFKNDLLGGKK